LRIDIDRAFDRVEERRRLLDLVEYDVLAARPE
jgi:hypothetical protein